MPREAIETVDDREDVFSGVLLRSCLLEQTARRVISGRGWLARFVSLSLVWRTNVCTLTNQHIGSERQTRDPVACVHLPTSKAGIYRLDNGLQATV